jgi:predicted Zn-dependent protease with MMP-like domain
MGRRYAARPVVQVDPDRFEELVADALDGIPPELGRLMQNVAVVVVARPHVRGLLGLYEGVPLTRRGNDYSGVMPDKITIFRDTICAICRDEAQVVEQVRITVVHEVAHHFGIDDHRLTELGWG